ncbi:MAG: sugar phosphate isomerase/epimerase family protein [Pseudomonadota bacterium]
MPSLPILGAAMKLDDLAIHREFMLTKPRDLELQDFVDAEVLTDDWRPLVDRAKSLLDGHQGRLGIHGPFWGFKLDSQDPEIRAVVQARLYQGLDVCTALGATQMVIHSPFTTWDYNNHENVEGSRELAFERCHATLDDVVARAESMGCVLVLENIEDKDPYLRRALAESFHSPAMAVSIDTGHAYYAHGSTGAPPVDYYVKAAGPQLHHLHLQDADGYADRHWSLGEGSLLWPSIFAAIAKYATNPRLIIELRDKSRIPASAAYLESLGLAE